MKYEITLIVEASDVLFEHDLKNGHVQSGIQTDVLESEQLIGFTYKKLSE